MRFVTNPAQTSLRRLFSIAASPLPEFYRGKQDESLFLNTVFLTIVRL